MTVSTVFDLASVTKVAATTLAAMILVERGLLELDAPVDRYLPGFVGGAKGNVTVEKLLAHRSGLAPWWPVYYHADNRDASLSFLASRPLFGPPGDARRYSDLGFMLLGGAIEAVAARPLDEFVAQEIYRPLGLSVTGYRRASEEPVASDSVVRHAATSNGNPFERRMVYDPEFGYRIDIDPESWTGWRRRTLVGEVNDANAFHAFGGVAGHAGLFSTASELARLVRLALSEGRYRTADGRGRRLFGAEVARRFLADGGDGQALGWQLPEYAPAGSFGHTGFTGTLVLGVPARDMVIVLLTNRQQAGLDADGRYPDVGPLQERVVRALVCWNEIELC